MKQSYYNVVAPSENGSAIVYNTLHQSLAYLSADEAALLDAPSIARSCNEQAIVNALSQAHFLLDDPEAEANYLLYRHKCHRNNKRALDITISPTRACNFSCDYCYIEKRPSFMSETTQDNIIEFLARHYASAPFSNLKVNWYGGEPLLALDVVEQLSEKLQAFCRSRGIAYNAHMLTNGSLASASVCKRLAQRCKLRTIMPTISGNGIMHDWQRCANDRREHFGELMRNIDHMLNAGITVHANFVVNHNNFQECKELAAQMVKKPGVVIRCTRTFDYGQGKMFLKDGKNTPIQLFSRAEFAPYYAEFHRALSLDASGYAEVLKPVHLYCTAWSARTFFIDEVGDVFQCMIDMDYPERKLCNVVDDPHHGEFNWVRYLDYDAVCPSRERRCRQCRVLPICQGGCICCRIDGADVCHDAKDSIEELVRDYYNAAMKIPSPSDVERH